MPFFLRKQKYADVPASHKMYSRGKNIYKWPLTCHHSPQGLRTWRSHTHLITQHGILLSIFRALVFSLAFFFGMSINLKSFGSRHKPAYAGGLRQTQELRLDSREAIFKGGRSPRVVSYKRGPNAGEFCWSCGIVVCRAAFQNRRRLRYGSLALAA